MRRSLVRPCREHHIRRPRGAMVRPRVIACCAHPPSRDAVTIRCKGRFAASPDQDDAAAPASWWSPVMRRAGRPGGAPEAEKEGTMAQTSDTPVIDLLGRMTVDSLEAASALDERTIMLVRLAALIAVDAPPA